jgi:hypothetical protein
VTKPIVSFCIPPSFFVHLINLSQLFQYVSGHPWPATAYFLLLPFVVWIVGLVASGSRNVKLWSYIYAILVYAVCIPGVFAVTLNMYLFLFERQSIWQTNVILQFLPVITMAISLILIKSKIPFSLIPGFGKISGFLTLIAALIGLMWFFDRIRLVAFTYVPFSVILIGFILTLIAIRFAWSKLF